VQPRLVKALLGGGAGTWGASADEHDVERGRSTHFSPHIFLVFRQEENNLHH